MMRWLVSLLLAAALWPAAASGGDVSPARGVPTLTRLVKLFSELEQTLDQRLGSGDVAAAERLLSDDFEQRNASAPSNPVPRAEWLRQTPRLGEISDMAVHDHGTLAIASFVARRGTQSVFIVDVWQNRQGEWKLATRYASGPDVMLPKPPPTIPKRAF